MITFEKEDMAAALARTGCMERSKDPRSSSAEMAVASSA